MIWEPEETIKSNKDEIIAETEAYYYEEKSKRVYHGGSRWMRVKLFKWASVNIWWFNWHSESEKYYNLIWPWTLTFYQTKIIFN